MGANDSNWFPKATAVIPLCIMMVLLTASAGGVTHIVGGSIWSIPPSTDFYANWSSSQTFYLGDVLYFDFESEMYNVHTVDSWSEYLDCVSLDSYLEDHVHDDGPALITLEDEPGFKRFICPMLDYCSQGMKLQLEALSR